MVFIVYKVLQWLDLGLGRSHSKSYLHLPAVDPVSSTNGGGRNASRWRGKTGKIHPRRLDLAEEADDTEKLVVQRFGWQDSKGARYT